MTMRRRRSFIPCESGAVTVDWVVVTAAAVSLALGVAGIVGDGLEEVGSRVDDDIRARSSLPVPDPVGGAGTDSPGPEGAAPGDVGVTVEVEVGL